jgi:Reverse transcriptase (RNA-dependent DNA polymerase)
LGLWGYEFPRPGDTPRPAIIKFKTKRDANGRELKKKVRIAIRGYLMKSGAEYNPDKSSSQTPVHTALRIFLAAGAAGSLPIEFLDVPGAYQRADADPSCRQTMRQLPRSDGSFKHPGCVLVLQKAMTGAPNAGYLWKQHREKDLVKLGWTVLENEPSAYYINNEPHWAHLLRNTDNLSLQASSQLYLDKVRKQLERTWNVTRQPLLPDTSVKHLGMKITRDNNGDIAISNPAFITNLLAANSLNDCNPSPTPHIDGQNTSKTTDADILTEKPISQPSGRADFSPTPRILSSPLL